MEDDSGGRIKCYPGFVMGTGKPAVTHFEMRPNAEAQTGKEGRKGIERLGLDALLEMFSSPSLTMAMTSPKNAAGTKMYAGSIPRK